MVNAEHTDLSRAILAHIKEIKKHLIGLDALMVDLFGAADTPGPIQETPQVKSPNRQEESKELLRRIVELREEPRPDGKPRTYPQIAEILGINVSTVSKKYRNYKKSLALEQEQQPEQPEVFEGDPLNRITDPVDRKLAAYKLRGRDLDIEIANQLNRYLGGTEWTGPKVAKRFNELKAQGLIVK
jgi:hypothetical protein